MSEYLTRWRERVRRNALLNNAWRVAVFTVGMAVLLAGIAMLVLPGPGWAAIFVGFAILATEFAWARVALLWAKDKAVKAKDKALAPETRRRNQLIAVAGGVVVAAGVIFYLERYGLNVPWAVG
ncbi:TIGR02611 family protein [Actinoallomurus sp. NBC_01490]|uniref:TIGR02611 family protein n=1 Tax=Actinoallomurus sp. NBC_01490 TaxID=2903557 RepID=UPI002E36CE26|nr:TIGR02611 family protein [Actinoallomurus sp. NBC_01490]